MLIREAAVTDIPGIARVHVETWRSAYRGIISDDYLKSLSYTQIEQFCTNTISDKNSVVFGFVAEDETEGIVGFAAAGPERTGNPDYKGELYAAYVLEAQQRKGIGRALVVAVTGRLLAMGITSLLVWVLKDNPCRRFYERIGGKLTGERLIDLGGVKYPEVAYGWADINTT